MATIASNQDNRRKLQSIAKFKTSHSSYSGLSQSDKRKRIKILLDKFNVAINASPISKKFVDDKGIADNDCFGEVTISGAVNVKAYYDGTDNTGEIKQGHPVAFDTVTGKRVTGVNEKWNLDEYKIVGMSLVDYELIGIQQNNLDLIPIILIQPGTPGGVSNVLFSQYRIPGRYINQSGDEIIGYAMARKIQIVDDPIYGKKIEKTGDWVAVAHFGRRDVRAGSYIVTSEDADSGLKIIVTEFFE